MPMSWRRGRGSAIMPARAICLLARAVVADHGGRFPGSEAELRALPGIGDYTAASVAAIAFGRPSVVIDANIERVIARHRLIETPLPLAKREISRRARAARPAGSAGRFCAGADGPRRDDLHPAQPGLRDLSGDGRLPRAARADIDRLPVKPPKKAKPHRHGIAHWIERDGQIWLVRRPGKGMLGGMRALPGGDRTDAPPSESGIARVDHGFTHFNLTLILVRRDAAPESRMPQRKANGGLSRTLTRRGCRRSIAS